tara:strand:- start:7716 stop:9863 length:2148 start_codon:yes stop_codon:yes gene_type:complete
MAPSARLTFAQARNVQFSHVHTIKPRIYGATSHAIPARLPITKLKATEVLHGQSPRQQLGKSSASPRPQRRECLAHVYTLDKECARISVSTTALKVASEHLRLTAVEKNRLQNRDKLLGAFWVPLINSSLLSLKDFQYDRAEFKSILDVFLPALSRLDRDIKSHCPGHLNENLKKSLELNALRWLHQHLYRQAEKGDLDDKWLPYHKDIEAFAKQHHISLTSTAEYEDEKPFTIPDSFIKSLTKNVPQSTPPLAAQGAGTVMADTIMVDATPDTIGSHAPSPSQTGGIHASHQTSSPLGSSVGQSVPVPGSSAIAISSTPMAGFSASAIQSSPPAMSASSHIAPALPTGIPTQNCYSIDIHTIKFEGLQACLDAYNQSTFRSACVTEQEELFAKLNLLDEGANSVDNFREIFLGVRSFLLNMGSFSHLTEELAAHARWWVDFVVQLRQDLKQHQWTSATNNGAILSLRRALKKMFDFFELHRMISPQASSSQSSQGTVPSTTPSGSQNAANGASNNSIQDEMVKSASSSAVSSSTDGNAAPKTSSPAQQDAAAKPAFDPSKASLDDIQFGRNAYDKANIASPDYLKAMFANPTYSQHLAECQSRLHAKLQAKTVIHEGNVSGMARACEYIMEAAKQPWWNHHEYHAAQELQECIGKMRAFAIAELLGLQHDTTNFSGLGLARDIEKVLNALNGRETQEPVRKIAGARTRNVQPTG